MEFTIEEVHLTEPRPMIVRLQSGELKPENPLNAKCFRHDKNIVFDVESMDVMLKGEVQEDEMNNFIIIRNKETNKVKLIQVDQAVVSPYIEKPKLSDSVLSEKTTVSELNKQFGSKRTKRRTEQRERMKMDVEHVREHLEKTVADIEIEDRNLVMPNKIEETVDSYVPPINRNASSKDQVYVLEKLVPLKVLNSLDEEAKLILESDLEEYQIQPLTKKYLESLQNSKPSNAVIKCKIFLYVDCLFHYIATPIKSITKNFRACSYSVDVNQHILDTFSVLSGNSRNRPLYMKDKCICYMIILLILALDYTINMEDITKAVKSSIKRLQEMGRVLGLHVSGNVLTLKLPLPAPVLTTSKRRKK